MCCCAQGVPVTISREASREVQHDGISRIIFRDIISRMLQYDPRQRIVPFEALHHYFFYVDEIARYILDSNTLMVPTKSPQIPLYVDTPSARLSSQSSRQYTENALREAARVLDKRMPGAPRCVFCPVCTRLTGVAGRHYDARVGQHRGRHAPAV